MIPQAYLYKPTGPDCEASHELVVVRIRGGVHSHIGGQTYDDETGDPIPLPAQGLVVPDAYLGGYWLVPAKHIEAFTDAWNAEQVRREAEAAAKKEG